MTRYLVVGIRLEVVRSNESCNLDHVSTSKDIPQFLEPTGKDPQDAVAKECTFP